MSSLAFGIYSFHIASAFESDTKTLGPPAIIGARGESGPSKSTIYGLHRGREGIVLWDKGEFPAEEWPALSLVIPPRNLDVQIKVFWRKVGEKSFAHSVVLPLTPWAKTTLNLSLHEEWEGTIDEIGLALSSETGFAVRQLDVAPMVIAEPKLRRLTPSVAASAILADWFRVRPWKGHSINTLTTPTYETPFISLTLFAGLIGIIWIASVLVILRLGTSPAVVGCIVLMLLPSVAWAGRLLVQTQFTQVLFNRDAVASPGIWELHPQVRRALDAINYLRDFSEQFAPDTRVMVIAQDPYVRMRLLYGLLPIDAAPVRPRSLKSARVGDYVLVVGDIPITYNEDNKVLRHRGRYLCRGEQAWVDSDITIYALTAFD